VSQAELRKKASAKWRNVKLVLMTSTVIIFSIPIALLPSALRRIQPTAEFVFLVVAPGLWDSLSTWITAPCLFVLLNIILVTLGFISRDPPTSDDDRPHYSGIISADVEVIEAKSDADADADHSNIVVQSKLADSVENNSNPAASPAQVQKPAAALVVERRSRSFKDLKVTLTPAPALYAEKSRLRRSTTKVSNLSKETRKKREMTITESCTPAAPKTSSPQLVVFEISTDVGDFEGDEECNILHHQGDGMPLSADELYVKAESFIGDFYRQLKMQREDSWNRLCGIYRRSC